MCKLTVSFPSTIFPRRRTHWEWTLGEVQKQSQIPTKEEEAENWFEMKKDLITMKLVSDAKDLRIKKI